MDNQKLFITQGDKSVYVEKVETLNIIYNRARKILRALTKPPIIPEVFLGREHDLQTIKSQLFSDNNTQENKLLLLINGQGGVGKTTIAAQYFHRYQQDYAHTAWVLSEKNIANALVTALEKPLDLQFEQTLSLEQRFDQLITTLSSLAKPCLLVIDNANEVDDLQHNYQNLRRCSNFHILLTTRITDFQQAARFHIEGLPEPEALILFKKYYPKLQDSEIDLVKAIRIAVDCNTLVMEVLSKNLAELNRLRTNYTLTNLLADLQAKGLLALSQSKKVGTDYQAKGGFRKEKPETIISAMYDLAELSPTETALLSMLSVLPAENIAFAVLEGLLSQDKFDDLEQHLLALAQKGWIDFNETKAAFKCSPVVQEITKNKNPQLFIDCKALINALIEKLTSEHYEITGSSFKDAALFCRYAESIVASTKECNSDLVMLSERIGVYLEATGNLEKALAFFSYNYDLVQELYAYYPNEEEVIKALLISCSNLGSVYTAFHEFKLALEVFAKSYEFSKERHTASPNDANLKRNFAVSLLRMGEAHTALWNLEQAFEFYGYALELFQELHVADPSNASFKSNLASTFQCMGETHTSLGNLELALEFFQDFNKLSLELLAAYPTDIHLKNTLAISCDKLGESHTALGNLERALEFYHSFNALEQELCTEYPSVVKYKSDLAISFERLGKTNYALRNMEKALVFFEHYLELTQELLTAYPDIASYKSSLAFSYQWLGNTYISLNDLEHALKFYEEFNRLEAELHSAYPTNPNFKNDLAISYQKLGETHFNLRNLEYAVGFFEEFNYLEIELHTNYPDNVGFKNCLAISYIKLGGINEQISNKELAAQHYQIAHDIWAELAANFPNHFEFKRNISLVETKLADF